MNRLDKARVMKNFSHAAGGYETRAALQKLVAERLLSRLDFMKLAPEWIMDAGSGTGASARQLRKKYRKARIVQLDLSRAMLMCARKKSPRWFSRQHFVCADAENLPVAANKIDLLFSSLMLHWCNDVDRALAEAGRILRPGGLYLFATLGAGTLHELRTSWSRVDDQQHVHPFLDIQGIGDALTRTGLEGVVMESENATLTYQDCGQLMRDLKTLGVNNAMASRPRGLTGRRRLQDMMSCYETYRAGGLLPATYEIIYGHAWAPAELPRHAASGQSVFIPVASLRRGQKRGITRP